MEINKASKNIDELLNRVTEAAMRIGELPKGADGYGEALRDHAVARAELQMTIGRLLDSLCVIESAIRGCDIPIEETIAQEKSDG